jgi:hypothetical protein
MTHLQNLCVRELKQLWPQFFRRQMPYASMHDSLQLTPSAYLDWYNALDIGGERLNKVVMHFNREPLIITTLRLDRAYLTVLGAFIYSLYANTWQQLNQPALLQYSQQQQQHH